MIFIVLILCLALILQISFTTVPVVLLVLIVATVITRKNALFFYAFGAGLLLDILTLKPLGNTSIFYLCILLFIFLYERKFEINTPVFVAFFSFVSVFLYCILFHQGMPIPEALFGMSIATFLYMGIVMGMRIKAVHAKGENT